MAASLNKAMIIGNLGRDPEIRSTNSGAKVANFSVATNESYTEKSTGQKIEKTEWHRIVMWRGLAEIAERFLRKGSTVYIEGKLSTRNWDDQNGQRHYSTEIIADQMQMLGNRQRDDLGDSGINYEPNDQQAPHPKQSAPAQPAPNYPNTGQQSSGLEAMPPAPEDDLPF